MERKREGRKEGVWNEISFIGKNVATNEICEINYFEIGCKCDRDIYYDRQFPLPWVIFFKKALRSI